MTETAKARYVARYSPKAAAPEPGAGAWYVLDRLMDDVCAIGLTKQAATEEAAALYHQARRDYGLEVA